MNLARLKKTRSPNKLKGGREEGGGGDGKILAEIFLLRLIDNWKLDQVIYTVFRHVV